MRPRAALVAAGAVATLGLVLAPSAQAACHAFDVAVDPSQAGEGATVTVTVTRDAAVNPSSVRVRTVDGTATAGQDYAPVDRRVAFTSETSQSFPLETLQDTADEPDETFRLELSEGQGCQVNQRFSYGSATVTIADDDESAAPPPTEPEPEPTAAPTTGAPQQTSAPTTEEEAATTTTTDEAATTATTGEPPERAEDLDGDELAAEADDDDDGGGAVGAIAAALVLAAAGGAGYLLYRRSQASPDSGPGS